MKDYCKELIKARNKHIRSLNINKIKKYLKERWKEELINRDDILFDIIRRINSMSKKKLYYEFICFKYDLPF